MSHNITSFRITKIKNLIVHESEFFKSKKDDWHPELKDTGDGYIIIEGGCGQTIKVEKEDLGFMRIIEMDLTGEGSGSFWYYILEHALKQSTGKLKATMIWEGQEIYKMRLKDGELTYKEIK